MIFRLCLCFVLLTGCSARGLTENEEAFAASLLGNSLDVSRVRVVDGAPTRAVTFRRKPRPRVTCRENIFPPAKDEIVTSKPAAVALFNRVLFDKDWYLDDYLPEYPDKLGLTASMLLAHELTHTIQQTGNKVQQDFVDIEQNCIGQQLDTEGFQIQQRCTDCEEDKFVQTKKFSEQSQTAQKIS